jgi:hypothetical protein
MGMSQILTLDQKHAQQCKPLHEVRVAAFLERASISARAVASALEEGACQIALDKLRGQRDLWLEKANEARERAQ